MPSFRAVESMMESTNETHSLEIREEKWLPPRMGPVDKQCLADQEFAIKEVTMRPRP